MKITSNMINKHWDTWKSLPSDERDKIIRNAFFDNESDNIPLFSRHTKSKDATDNLVAAMKERGCSDIIVEQCSPSSSRAVVSIDGNRLSATPDHKGIAFIAYIVAMESEAL